MQSKMLTRLVCVLSLLMAVPAWAQMSSNGGGLVAPSQGGFGTAQTFPSADFDQPCVQNGAGTGPGSANQMTVQVIYQPFPFAFTNGEIVYNPSVADASVESDVCIYQWSAASSGTLTLIADTGLIAIASAGNPNPSPALGGGTSNLTTQPTSTTCGSGGGTCTAGVFPPGYYGVALASVATTAKMKTCASTIAAPPTYFHSGGTSATSGECPLSVTSATLTAPNVGTAPVVVSPW